MRRWCSAAARVIDPDGAYPNTPEGRRLMLQQFHRLLGELVSPVVVDNQNKHHYCLPGEVVTRRHSRYGRTHDAAAEMLRPSVERLILTHLREVRAAATSDLLALKNDDGTLLTQVCATAASGGVPRDRKIGGALFARTNSLLEDMTTRGMVRRSPVNERKRDSHR